MRVTIENIHGCVVYSERMSDDVIMDGAAMLARVFPDSEFVGVNQIHESLGCYDYRVLFWDEATDEDERDSLLTSSAFYLKDY